ncbi:hypothetical protein HanOQP8_Chr15g0572171 [Helianthus annuus]|nr:hypothetical protein HanOQP8_Chr15g0572171 [Helianthus annuus]
MEPGISMTTNWNCTISVTSFVITSSNHAKYIEVLPCIYVIRRVMNMLGPSLWDIWSSLGQSMTPKSTACASKASLWFSFLDIKYRTRFVRSVSCCILVNEVELVCILVST